MPQPRRDTAGALALGEFVAELRATPIPDAVTERARAHLLYNLACGMTTDTLPVEQLLRRPAGGLGMSGEAGLVGHPGKVPAEFAAFINGALIHSRAQDDSHFASQSHPGAAVIPAALALAEREGASGDLLLTALVAGYEVTASVGEPLADALVARGFRAASVFGTLGAAAAAAVVLELDERAAGDAIAIAASFAAGLSETWIAGSAEWPWQLGAAARSGITAAQLAQVGVHGATTALEGRVGLAGAFSSRDAWTSPDEWQLGERWRTLEVIYKRYPVCDINQGPLALAATIGRRLADSGEHITAVRCFLHPADRSYPGTLNHGPFADRSSTLMSAPYCIAIGLKYGTATPASLREYDDPVLLDTIKRTEIVADERLGPLSARLEIDTDRGNHVEELAGDNTLAPSGWDEAIAMGESLAAELPGALQSFGALRSNAQQLQHATDVRALLRATATLGRTAP